MKLELNEKLWFGKYKDKRLIDIINDNPDYIKKLLNDYDIKLSDSVIKYYNNRNKPKIDDTEIFFRSLRGGFG